MANPLPPPAPVSYALPVHRPGDEVIVAWRPATGAFTARITETYSVDGHPFVADVPIPGRGSGPMTFTTADDLLATVDPFVHIPHGFATQLRLDQAQPQSSVRPPGGWGGQTTAHHDPDPATLPCIVIDPPPFPPGPPPPAPPLPAAADRALTPALLRAYASGAGADLFDLGRRAWLLGFTSSGTDHDAGDLAAFARAAADRPDLRRPTHSHDRRPAGDVVADRATAAGACGCRRRTRRPTRRPRDRADAVRPHRARSSPRSHRPDSSAHRPMR